VEERKLTNHIHHLKQLGWLEIYDVSTKDGDDYAPIRVTPRGEQWLSGPDEVKTAAAPKVVSEEIAAKPTGSPLVFISYTHETPEHKRWVLRLGEDLLKNGIQVILDQWDVAAGADLTLFMEDGIRRSDRVLLICTPVYQRKANEAKGGVGYERMVVTGEIAAKINTTKFVPILRDGTKESSIPTFASTRLYLSFVDDVDYKQALEGLLRELHQSPLSPKPRLGQNPFQTPAETSAAPPGIVQGIEASEDAERAYSQGENILRARDLLGWNRLVRRTRSQVSPRLLKWRLEVEKNGGTQNAQWERALCNGVQILGPSIVLALTAVESELPELRQQRGLLDELLSIEGWNRAGLNVVIETPSALALFYHHILGGFLVRQGRLDDAINLLRGLIRFPGGSHTCELWRASPVMGWSVALGHDAGTSWNWLGTVYREIPSLAHFFETERVYRDWISSYLLCASAIELASALKRSMIPAQVEHMEIPLMYLPRDPDDLASLITRTLNSAHVTEVIAGAYGINPDTLRRSWPAWVMQLYAIRQKYNDGFWSVLGLREAEIAPLP
jgi:hypothetical protein